MVLVASAVGTLTGALQGRRDGQAGQTGLPLSQHRTSPGCPRPPRLHGCLWSCCVTLVCAVGRGRVVRGRGAPASQTSGPVDRFAMRVATAPAWRGREGGCGNSCRPVGRAGHSLGDASPLPWGSPDILWPGPTDQRWPRPPAPVTRPSRHVSGGHPPTPAPRAGPALWRPACWVWTRGRE